MLDSNGHSTAIRPGDKMFFDQESHNISFVRNTGLPMCWADGSPAKKLPSVKNKAEFVEFAKTVAEIFDLIYDDKLDSGGVIAVCVFLKK